MVGTVIEVGTIIHVPLSRNVALINAPAECKVNVDLLVLMLFRKTGPSLICS